MKIIARIHTDFSSKFGIPRQSGIVDELEGMIVFEPEYRNPDSLRGLNGFSHVWIIWKFSETERDTWSPTVRPPRLGGSTRMGVFATRSPFRPNPIGLSSVRLMRIQDDPGLGTVLYVSGADLMDNTPIFDIKPYLPYTDSHPDAVGGFADSDPICLLKVTFPDELLVRFPEERREALIGVLANDPRPPYQNDPERVYGFEFWNYNIEFRVDNAALYVCGVTPL